MAPTAPHHASRTASIASFAHDGRGVAHVDGKTVFIDGALPGETVEFVYTRLKRDYAEARLLSLITASPDRVAPRCPHFGVCGGCSLQHLRGEAQIRMKQDQLLEQLRRIGKVEPHQVLPALTGPLWGYRHKARLGVKYVRKKGRILVGFRERHSAYLAELNSCAILQPRIGERLTELGGRIVELSIRERLPQIEVAVGDQRCVLVFRVLEDPTREDQDRLRALAQEMDCDVYLQRGGPDTVQPLEPEAPPLPSYDLPGRALEFRFHPSQFTQVNPDINRRMVDRVLELMNPQPEQRLLDLYCGIGNFTLPLAQRAGRVDGVEGLAELVRQARDNARHNRIGNAFFHRADLAQDVSGEAFAQGRYDQILLDPGRAGADRVLRQFARWKPGRVVYVSCNPATLARDAGILVHELKYRLLGAGVMDMFPHTAHVESIALFEP